MDRRELFGLVAIAILVVAGAAFWYARSLPGPVSVELASGGAREPNGSAFGASPSPSPASILVYVTGWVRKPGVYQLRQGDRVIDAIRLAGGAKHGADLASVNLAAFLTDAQQITVAKRGAVGAVGSGGSGGSGSLGGAGPGATGGLININTATLEELESLPGIGPALGHRILDYRTEPGPVRTVDDLTNVSGIGDKRLADLRSKATV